jgi:hypothetical protein
VSLHKGSWRAAIQKQGETQVVGYFQSEIDAAEAYNNRAKALFGDHAKMNEFQEK